jgi:GntR family transcriptional regulator / MocR family aminotransferase
MELTLTFDGNEPLYMQLYLHIRRLIQSGYFKNGAKLPSIRSLKQQLNVSKITVETAYHMLLEEGYVVSKERSGFIVAQSPLSPSLKPSIQADQAPDRSLQLQAIEDDAVDDLIDFNLLTIDGDSFPFRRWKSIVHEALSLHAQSIHQYGDVRGEYGLREALTHYLRKSRGVVCEPDQIIVGTGISYSVQLLSKLLEDHDKIGIEKPGIAQIHSFFAQSRFHLTPLPMEDSQLLELELEHKQIRLLYVTPSHRPTGDPLPYAARLLLLQWVSKQHGYIIEDDYDGELRLHGRSVPALQGLDTQGVVIYIGTFSKVFTPALRMNYMVLPPSLAQKVPSLTSYLSCPSRIDQWAMQLFITRGYWYRHLRRIRKIYREKQEKLVQLLRDYLPASVGVEGSKAGLHIELSMPAAFNVEQMTDMARREGVLVYGSQDEQGDSALDKPKIYIGFGGIKEQDMERGVQRLTKAWSSIFGS